MTDYSKLAGDFKSGQENLERAAEADRLRNLRAFEFFRSIEVNIGSEIAKANLRLGQVKATTGDYVNGISMSISDERRKLDVSFGPSRECCLALDAKTSRITIRMTNSERDRAIVENMAINVTLGQDGEIKVRSDLIKDGMETSEVTALQVAEIVVAAMIEGHL